jgi:hypothetical protein
VPPDQGRNKLWINQQDGTFKNEARKYGIDDPGYAVNAHFFDMDKDGDLDIYLVNQGPEKNANFNMTVSREEPNEYCGDKLYRNDGSAFTDVTLAAGIYSSLIGFGHGAAVGDVNNDGWDDIYVCNDFFEHDYLYINQKDGTFSEELEQAIEHTSNYSMGNDMADFNNDGLLDIMVLDMIAEDYRRQKRMMSGMDAQLFWRAHDQGYLIQYMANTLQLNNGSLQFSEIAHLAGVSHTDWSWGPLFADFDGDGYKDLFVSNGLRKDIRNLDWARKYNQFLDLYSSYELFPPKEWDNLLNALPSEKIPNYIYRNNQDLTFTNTTTDWGLHQPSFSNGAAYGDLDNDGDLDLVVNNVDDPAFVYENLSNTKTDYNYLRIDLNGPKQNKLGLGSKIYLTTKSGQTQMQQLYLSRGYRSSVDPRIVFGLGQDSVVAKLEVHWPDSSISRFNNLTANQTIVIEHDKGNALGVVQIASGQMLDIFQPVKKDFGIDYEHRENYVDPYQYQPLLPYKLSDIGPAAVVADFNGDRLDDLFLGNARGRRAHMFIQSKEGKFEEVSADIWYQDRSYEDISSTPFDVDQDGDLDLYVVSGGYSLPANHEDYEDRLYLNDGNGNFIRDSTSLSGIRSSGSKAIADDYDKDGDTDVLVTGRLYPRQYPLPADTYILENIDGSFKNVTAEIAPELLQLGMVSDGLWSDYDGDGDLDIILVGEWMGITILNFEAGKYYKLSTTNGLEKTSGWWNCIEKFDFDGDGDDDYVAGNLGLNYRYQTSLEYPFQLFTSDFNSDERQDIVLAYYEDETLFPVENLERSMLQFPELGVRINSHDQFSEMDLEQIYGAEALRKAENKKAFTFESSMIENLGHGRFDVRPLPKRAQISNINDIIIEDYNNDGIVDLLVAGNLYDAEVQTVRIDAGVGLLLTGDGNGNFVPVPPTESRFYARGDVRQLLQIEVADNRYIMVIRNDDKPTFILVSGN